MCLEEDGNAHGVFLLNSNAMGRSLVWECGSVSLVWECDLFLGLGMGSISLFGTVTYFLVWEWVPFPWFGNVNSTYCLLSLHIKMMSIYFYCRHYSNRTVAN